MAWVNASDIRYACRSLWRNRRRSVLTIVTVTLSVLVSTVASRYAAAVLTLWEDATCDHGTGHAQIHRTGYWENPDSVDESLTFASQEEVEQEVRRDSEVLAVARRLRIEGIVSNGDKSMYFMGIGVDPVSELRVSPQMFNPESDAGSFVKESVPDGVVLGKGMAETLGLKIGDELTLISQTAQGSVNGIDVRVVGIVNFPIPALSKRLIYMHLAHLQRLIRIGDRYSELVIRLRNPSKLEQWAKLHKNHIEARGGNLQTWWEIEPVIRDVEKIWYTVVGVVVFLLFGSAALSVLSIIFVTVAERTVEIGTLMALGAKPSRIRKMFSIEAGIIGVAGSVLGTMLAIFSVLIMGLVGVPFDSPYGLGSLLVFPTISWTTTLEIALLAVAICTLASLPPSRKASQVDPVLAFRGQIS